MRIIQAINILFVMLSVIIDNLLAITDINVVSPLNTNEYVYFYTHNTTTDCTNTFGVFTVDTFELPGSNRLDCLAMCTREPLCNRVSHEANSLRCLISDDAEVCPYGQMQWLVKIQTHDDSTTIASMLIPAEICETDVNEETGTCYWASEERMTWQTANQFCQADGGFLAHMKTQATQDFVLGYGVIGSVETWISINDLADTGFWLWGDGSSVTWTNWQSGQPSSRTEHCVRLRPIHWADNHCDETYAVLCEIEV